MDEQILFTKDEVEQIKVYYRNRELLWQLSFLALLALVVFFAIN